MSLCTSSSTRNAARASLILSTWQPRRTSSCASTMPVWKSAWRLLTHSRTPHKDKSDCYFIPAGEAFSPACFVMPFFSCANFAGLFSFQLLTFVCRTPIFQPNTVWSSITFYRAVLDLSACWRIFCFRGSSQFVFDKPLHLILDGICCRIGKVGIDRKGGVSDPHLASQGRSIFLSVVGIIFHKIRASLHLLLVLGGPVLAIIYERNHKKFPIRN